MSDGAHSAEAYWVVQPGRGELRPEPVAARPAAGRSIVVATAGAISPGTERLVGLGRVPRSEQSAMACRYMAGDFSLPVKYGYCVVGDAVAGALAGRRVFVMHPHQSVLEIDDRDAWPLPAELEPRRAVLIPNLETALNAVWDAAPGADEQALVVGGGAVGLLVAYAWWRETGRRAAVVETDAARAERAAALPFVASVCGPEGIERGGVPLAFHASGTGAGLQCALDAVGFEGRVIELSWYGTEPVTLRLGGTFHSQRKRLIASQVGSIAAPRRATHGFADRLRAVVALLDDAALDVLLGAAVAFADLPAAMQDVYAGGCRGPIPVVEYTR